MKNQSVITKFTAGVFGLLVVTAACTPLPGPTVVSPPATEIKAPVQVAPQLPVVEKQPLPPIPRVQGDLAIAGGEVRSDYPVVIAFPNLFLPLAALPVPEEMSSLAGIARLMTENPDIPWILECGGYDPESERYSLRLAAERASLLLRYLTRQGIPPESVSLKPVVSATPLLLRQGGGE